MILSVQSFISKFVWGVIIWIFSYLNSVVCVWVQIRKGLLQWVDMILGLLGPAIISVNTNWMNFLN